MLTNQQNLEELKTKRIHISGIKIGPDTNKMIVEIPYFYPIKQFLLRFFEDMAYR